MGKINFSTAVKNLTKNFWLLFSTIAALCLFLLPSYTSLMVAAVIFAAVVVAVVFDVAKPAVMPMRNAQRVSIILTALIAYMGFETFKAAWASSGKVNALAGILEMTVPTLLLIVGAVGHMVGFYSMYVMSCWIVSLATKLMQERLPVQCKAEIRENLKRNWYFPISAMAFFCLEFRFAIDYFVGLIIVLLFMIVIASQVSDVVKIVKGRPWYFNLFIILSGIGICWRGQKYSYATWDASLKLQALEGMLPFNIDIPMCISLTGAVSAFVFVFMGLTCFWTALAKALYTCFEKSKSKGSAIIFAGLACILIIVSSVIFLSTDVFYGTDISSDLIYTSDSPMLLKNDVYLSLTYAENDLRQPLFAVFASPFIGLPYLVCKLINPIYSVQAVIINAVQIAMLIFANYLLTKMLKLSGCKAVCFMLFSCCSYSQLLSVLMMEQYIIAYFWLILCLYLIVEKQKPDRIALWGAGGTLLTSMILLPFMSKESPIKNFKQWLMDMVKYGMEFIGLMLLMGRFDIFYKLTIKLSLLSKFTGKTITLADKAKQYFSFIRNCIFAPDAGIDTETFQYISWQLNPVTAVDFAGVFLFLLVVISAVWNRDKKSSLLAAGWIGFSMIMLLVIGWGTKENGLILYVLYFGWAFQVLLFQLVEKIESKLNVRCLIPVFTVCAVAVLLIVNIPAIMEMVDFAITYYPV